MTENITDRLRFLADSAGQKTTPWLKSLGCSGGMISKLMGGQQPNAELMVRLTNVERANWYWLQMGGAAPYRVERVGDIEDAERLMDCWLPNAWRVFRVISENGHRPDILWVFKQKSSPLVIHVLHGDVTLERERELESLRDQQKLDLEEALVSSKFLDRLIAGEVGNRELDLELTPGRATLDEFHPRVSATDVNESDTSAGKMTLSHEERLLVERYRLLPTKLRASVRELMAGMADSIS